LALSLPRVFFSYSRVDAPTVARAADIFRKAGLEVLRDVEFLTPGATWADVIAQELLASDALVFFVSPSSKSSTWMTRELSTFLHSSNRPVFPILLPPLGFEDLPPELATIQAIQLSSGDDAEMTRAARDIVRALEIRATPGTLSGEAKQHAQEFAQDIAADLRSPRTSQDVNRSGIFLVHGHDHTFRDEVRGFMQELGVDPVILSQVRSRSRSLLDRFETVALQADFAVILLSSDDVGAARTVFEDREHGGTQTLKYRPRQNVVLELGFFFGRLGWEKVAVIFKGAPRPWPEFDLASDLAGAVFLEVDGELDWRSELKARLHDASVLPYEDR
jgi:predicted nucleotide-binding protein